MIEVSSVQPGGPKQGSVLPRLIDALVLVIFLVLLWQVLCQLNDRVVNNPTVYTIKNGVFEHVDFVNTYMIGKMALSADSHQLYDPATQLKWYDLIIAPARVESSSYVQYPPYYPALFSALTVLPLRQAFLVWNAFSLSMGVFGLYLGSRAGYGLSRLGGIIVAAASIVSFPSSHALLNGEMTWLFVALFSMYYFCFVRGKPIAAGLALGFMALKPHYFLVLLIPSILSKNWRLLCSGAFTLFALIVFSGFMVGWENVINYPHVVVHYESMKMTGIFPERMVCLRGLLSAFFSTADALHIAFVGWVVGMLLTAFLWYRSLQQKKLSTQLAMALTIVILLISTPHLHFYDCVLLSVPAVLTLPAVRPTELVRVRPASFNLWCGLLMLYPLLGWLFITVVPPVACMVTSPSVQAATVMNGIKCGLFSCWAFLFCHTVFLILGLIYIFKNPDQATSGASDVSKGISI